MTKYIKKANKHKKHNIKDFKIIKDKEVKAKQKHIISFNIQCLVIK